VQHRELCNRPRRSWADRGQRLAASSEKPWGQLERTQNRGQMREWAWPTQYYTFPRRRTHPHPGQAGSEAPTTTTPYIRPFKSPLGPGKALKPQPFAVNGEHILCSLDTQQP
jgi:hypothetical protein